MRFSLFPTVLALVFLLFVGLLVYVWIGAEDARPVMLDEKGHVRQSRGVTAGMTVFG